MTFSLHHYKNETWACWTASCATRIRFKTAASVIKLCFIWLIQYSFILLDASPATAWQSSCDTSNEAQSSEEYPKAYEYALSTEARRQEDKGAWIGREVEVEPAKKGERKGRTRAVEQPIISKTWEVRREEEVMNGCSVSRENLWLIFR